MPRRPAIFTEAEYKRMFRAAAKTGLTPEVNKDGTIRFLKSPTTTGPEVTPQEADREIVV